MDFSAVNSKTCMVAQPKESIVLVAVVLIDIITYCSAENVYCVTPTAMHLMLILPSQFSQLHHTL